MQNIKICPKCNQATPDANNTFCPYDGTPLVEMQPIQSQQPQQPPSNFTVQANPTPTNSSPTKRVGILLGIGILFMPYIFSWFTLQKGYSNLTKIVSLSWMGLVLLINIPIMLKGHD